ncbi:MAG TPA: PAAR domain-containing protein, partial [Bacillota bacterium]|nr:PAAR domain-containing protein [Bacillota bacterium]
KIMGKPAATVDSIATNTPPHVPQGGPFQKPPSNQGKIQIGSATVKINGKPAARNGDPALTCNDPTDQPVGKVVATGTVMIGG